MKTKLMSMAAFALLAALNANAQIEKGSWMLGGNISYSKLKDESMPQINQYKYALSENTVFGASAGIAIKQNQIIGVVMGYGPGTSRQETLTPDSSILTSNFKGHQKGVGVFYRAYKHLGNKFFFYGQATAWYSNGRYINNSAERSMNTTDLSLSPGLAYQLLQNVFLEIGIPNVVSVGHSKSKSNNMSTTKDFYINTNLNSKPLEHLGIGFKIFIP